VRQTGVARVADKTGTIVEVSRICRPPGGALKERVTLDIPGHGEVTFSPGDIEVLKG
jgi:spore maturation protein SpmA